MNKTRFKWRSEITAVDHETGEILIRELITKTKEYRIIRKTIKTKFHDKTTATRYITWICEKRPEQQTRIDFSSR